MVLDTHILIRMVNGEKLPTKISNEIKRNNHLMISAITGWEVFMLEKYNKLKFSIPSAAWLGQALKLFQIETIPMGLSVCHKANSLQWHHRDPADRFIVATALSEGVPLITLDTAIIESKLVKCIGS